MLDIVVDVRVVQHGLGGDTANVQAGTTKGATLLDTGNLSIKYTHIKGEHCIVMFVSLIYLQTLLGGLDSGRVATRTTANHDNIVFGV